MLLFLILLEFGFNNNQMCYKSHMRITTHGSRLLFAYGDIIRRSCFTLAAFNNSLCAITKHFMQLIDSIPSSPVANPSCLQKYDRGKMPLLRYS